MILLNMNILIICRCLSIGGAERVAASWANGLNRLGNKVYVMTDTSIQQTYELDSNIAVIPLPQELFQSTGWYRNIKLRLNFIKQVIHEVDINAIDVIIKVLYVNAIELLIAKYISKRKPPIIMTDHNAYERPECAPMSKKLKFNKFWLNRLFDKVTVLTKRDKEITDFHGLKNVEVLYNPLFQKPINHISGNKEKIVLAVGRIDSWHYKGFDILIKAWNKICPSYPNWRLIIVGKGSKANKDWLYSLSEYPDQIEIKDFTPNITEEFHKASIFVLSSRYEAWGLVLVEAMSQGCACIACDYMGRQSEIITNNIDGILCRPENEESLSNSLDTLIRNTDLRRSIRNRASGNLVRFSEYIVANQLFNIIKDIVK